MADLKPNLGGATSSSKGKILVVDDEADIVRLLAFALQADGYQTLTAKNGPEGLEKARAEKPDLVILDVMMPGMDGFEVCAELRGKPETAGLPVIILSALGQVSDRVKGLRAGADDYVPKPVNLDELSARVSALLGRTRRQQPTGTSKSGKVYGVIGAKGGVGTTTIALNLAALLAQQQKKTAALVEMRSSYGTLATHLKWTPAENISQLMDLSAGQIDERALNARLHNTTFGVRVLFGPQRIEEFRDLSGDAVGVIVRRLSSMVDYVVLDLPNNFDLATQAAARSCDLVTLVLETDPSCVQAAKITLDLLKSWGVSGGLVSALISNRSGLTTGANLRDIKTQLGAEIIGVVPFAGEACMAALAQGLPLAIQRPDNIAAMTIKEMVARLLASTLIGIRL